MKWEKLKIKDFASVVTGGTPSTSVSEYWDNGNIPWLNSGELNQGLVTSCSNYITNAGLKNSSTKMMPADTVLIALTGATTGVTGYLTFEASANQSVTGILPSQKHEPRYLYYYLSSIRPKILNDAYGGAQKHISQQYVKEIEVLLPPLNVQKKIADTLDKADALRKKDQQLLRKYEELEKALYFQFINSVESKEVSLIELAEGKDGIKCGPFGTQLLATEFQSKGIFLWGIKHVNKHFSFNTTEFVSEEKAKELESYNIKSGDLVMTRKGTIGNVCIYPNHLAPGIMHSDLLRLRVDSNLVNNIFMQYQFRFDNKIKEEITKISHGAIMAGINVSKLKKLKVRVPSMKLQNEFSKKISRIFDMKKSLSVSDEKGGELFQSLISKFLS